MNYVTKIGSFDCASSEKILLPPEATQVIFVINCHIEKQLNVSIQVTNYEFFSTDVACLVIISYWVIFRTIVRCGVMILIQRTALFTPFHHFTPLFTPFTTFYHIYPHSPLSPHSPHSPHFTSFHTFHPIHPISPAFTPFTTFTTFTLFHHLSLLSPLSPHSSHCM